MSSPTEPITISPSRLSVFRECPKKYDYQYNQELSKISLPTKTFDKGNYFHELCHVYYRYIQSGVRVGSQTAVTLMKDRIKEDLGRNFTPERLTLFSTISKQFVHYVEKRSPEIDSDIEVLGVEEAIKVPVELPSGRMVYLGGIADLVYKRRVQGEWVYKIRDHKTDTSGQQKSIFDSGGAELSEQLLHYATAKFVETGIPHSVEISWINTKDFKTKTPSYEESFALFPGYHSEVALSNFLGVTLQVIDQMLDSPALPHYDVKVCKYCPFRLPCIGERRGVPADRILAFKYVPRAKSRERTLTDENPS